MSMCTLSRSYTTSLSRPLETMPGKQMTSSTISSCISTKGTAPPADWHLGNRLHNLLADLVQVLVGGRHAAQVKQRKAERRVHERGLHVDAQQHAEPDQVYAQLG